MRTRGSTAAWSLVAWSLAIAPFAATAFPTFPPPPRLSTDVLSTLTDATSSDAVDPTRRDVPVPIVIWHGLGDKFDNPGLVSLKRDLEHRPGLEGVFVHLVQIGQDGPADQRATFFGNANAQIAQACAQLRSIPEIVDPSLNPSGKFDAIGFSQGGQLLRALVERCGGRSDGSLRVRHLITLGSQHMGIDALPPCPPDSSPLSPCHLMHLSLLRTSIYSSYAQSSILPAQYFRDESTDAAFAKYLAVNGFLRDINNEVEGDSRSGRGRRANELATFDRGGGSDDNSTLRNASYKANFEQLEKLVLIRFSDDATVVPPHSAHFTLPDPDATNCPSRPSATCYKTPLDPSLIPLYARDYNGLRTLDERGKVERLVCNGVHMEISDQCWDTVVRYLGKADRGTAVRHELAQEDDTRLLFQGSFW
ncbi:hypothetical protein JCM10212_007061 [Sporobolomyces blumeae]